MWCGRCGYVAEDEAVNVYDSRDIDGYGTPTCPVCGDELIESVACEDCGCDLPEFNAAPEKGVTFELIENGTAYHRCRDCHIATVIYSCHVSLAIEAARKQLADDGIEISEYDALDVLRGV